MTDKSKLMGQLTENITRKVVERLGGTIEGMSVAKDDECTNGHTCDASMHTCSSNDFGCDSFVCEHDFSG